MNTEMSKDITQYPTDMRNDEVRSLITDLRQIIDKARVSVAAAANCELTMMYWHIGERINRDLLNHARAAYGEKIVATLSRQLQNDYGSKPCVQNLHTCHPTCVFLAQVGVMTVKSLEE